MGMVEAWNMNQLNIFNLFFINLFFSKSEKIFVNKLTV